MRSISRSWLLRAALMAFFIFVIIPMSLLIEPMFSYVLFTIGIILFIYWYKREKPHLTTILFYLLPLAAVFYFYLTRFLAEMPGIDILASIVGAAVIFLVTAPPAGAFILAFRILPKARGSVERIGTALAVLGFIILEASLILIWGEGIVFRVPEVWTLNVTLLIIGLPMLCVGLILRLYRAKLR